MRCLVWIGLIGCQAQSEVQAGPTFGGDQRSGSVLSALQTGALPSPEGLSEAGVLAALPLAIGETPCEDALCVETRAAWLPDGSLLVGFGVEGTRERPPAEVMFTLDTSASVDGSEDVRAATVEIALDRLNEDDTLGVWGFAGLAEPLVLSAPVTPDHRAEVRTALGALDALPEALEAAGEACLGWSEVLALYDQGTPETDTGDAGQVRDTGADTEASLDTAQDLEPLFAWVDTVLESRNEDLGPALLSLACAPGSDLIAGVGDPAAQLPDGSETRASRLVIVSDLQGEAPIEAVFEAAERGVGTSVLGVTSGTNREAMAVLAAAPGAHMLDALEPAAALQSWEARFDAWMAPTSWGLTFALAEASRADWTLVRRVGMTDLDGTGVNAVFASRSHGMVAAVLEPSGDAPAQPRFAMTSTTLNGVQTLEPWSRVPVRLLSTPWGEGDDTVALELAWRVALLDSVREEDASAFRDLLVSAP